MRPHHTPSRGFTLPELLVVIGIIVLLLAFLLPAVASARKQAIAIKCQAQLRDVGVQLLIYANDNDGWLFPADRGTGVPREERWPTRVFKPPVHNPPIMLCPNDIEPENGHSYLLNGHFSRKRIKYGRTRLGRTNVTQVVLMGEKQSTCPDYYMEPGEFGGRVELFAHGLKHGSNYLFLDLHVSNLAPELQPDVADPWDVPIPPELDTTTKPTTGPS